MRIFLVALATCAALVLAVQVQASGISVDAGLTPAEDRWIVRMQASRASSKSGSGGAGMRMTTVSFPLVLAYGLRRNVMVMAKQPFMLRTVSKRSGSVRATGFGDTMIAGKYLLWRRNTENGTFGVSPVGGVMAPTGHPDFSPGRWMPRIGLYFSARHGALMADFNGAYAFPIGSGRGAVPSGKITLDSALSYQLDLRPLSRSAVAPVLEYSYVREEEYDGGGGTMPGTGGSVVWISPGLKWSFPSLIIECLARFPVWTSQWGNRPDYEPGVLGGVRLFF